MKTLEEWENSYHDLEDYLNVGDRVDEEMYYHFLEIVPPVTDNNNNLMQVGEPYSHVKGKPTYTTFYNDGQGWIYAGVCFEGKTKHQNS